MTARTRKATKTTPPPAKKATAKKATARKRAPRKTIALTLVNPGDATPEPDTATQANVRPNPFGNLKRRRLFVGPMGPNEQAAIRAALASAALRLPVPVRTWNGSQAQLADGTLLIHNPGYDRAFTAHIACRTGAIHGYPITHADDLKTARALTKACERRHTDKTPGDDGIELDWHKAIARGIQHTTRLADGLTTAKKAVADTQPLSTDAIAAHIAEQLAHTEDAKEHPQP